MQIKLTKGLDLPISGGATGPVRPTKPASRIAATFDNPDGQLKLLVKTGDRVSIGTPLVEHKRFPGMFFVSPGGGQIGEIHRAERRSVRAITIDLDGEEQAMDLSPPSTGFQTPFERIEYFKRSGAFAHLRRRPFDQICDPAVLPRSIFVKALESAPLIPSAETQVEGWEAAFAAGLKSLAELAPVHLICKSGTQCQAFLAANSAQVHSIDGPHPSANPSVHIQAIDPIESVSDAIWTIDVLGVLAIGTLELQGRYFTERVIALAGDGFAEGVRGYYRARQGQSLADLAPDGFEATSHRLISGDPLTGRACERGDYMGLDHTAVIALPEAGPERQMLNFMRLGREKFTATKTYLSRLLPSWPAKAFRFTTHRHGDERAFIDPRVYDPVMPLDLCVAELVKACQIGDWAKADQLGLLQVAAEDFALPTFICPSKIEMSQIIARALKLRAQVDD